MHALPARMLIAMHRVVRPQACRIGQIDRRPINPKDPVSLPPLHAAVCRVQGIELLDNYIVQVLKQRGLQFLACLAVRAGRWHL